jgi:hypothetical protein
LQAQKENQKQNQRYSKRPNLLVGVVPTNLRLDFTVPQAVHFLFFYKMLFDCSTTQKSLLRGNKLHNELTIIVVTTIRK